MNRFIGYAVLGLVAVLAVSWIATGNDFFLYRYFAPKRANVERQVFENTQSYVQGKTEYLSRLRYQYQQASGDQKQSLRQLIISEASTVDNSKLPLDLQGFINQMKGTL